MGELRLMGMVRGVLGSLLYPEWDRDRQLHLSGQGEQLTAPGAAPYQEITRQGRAFFVNTTTAIGAVVAVPSTAHMLAIYNNEDDGGESLVIDWVAAQN